MPATVWDAFPDANDTPTTTDDDPPQPVDEATDDAGQSDSIAAEKITRKIVLFTILSF